VAKKPYSTEFTARSNPRRYLLSGIPPTLWTNVQRRARQQNISVRSLILTLLEGWLARGGSQQHRDRDEQHGNPERHAPGDAVDQRQQERDQHE